MIEGYQTAKEELEPGRYVYLPVIECGRIVLAVIPYSYQRQCY